MGDKEKIDFILRRLPSPSQWYDGVTTEEVRGHIEDLHIRQGWSVDDTVLYLRWMEDLNPNGDERMAVSIMTKLRLKYAK